MSALHLLWIIPLSMVAGAVCMALVAVGSGERKEETMDEALTVAELADFLQKLVAAGKGDYRIRSAEFESHTITVKDFGGIDDENKELWYTP